MNNFLRSIAAQSRAAQLVYVLQRDESGTMWSTGCVVRSAAEDLPGQERSFRNLRFREADLWRAGVFPEPDFLSAHCLRNAPRASGPDQPSQRQSTAGREHR